MSPDVVDRLAIQDLVHRYAWLVDELDPEGVADLFVPDGVIAACMNPGSPEITRERRGRDEIVAVIRHLDRFLATTHAIVGHIASVDGDKGLGLTRCIAHHVQREPASRLDLVLSLRYLDAYTRSTDGWRFQRRLLLVDMESEADWSGRAAPTPRP
jgi:hypothetical protein